MDPLKSLLEIQRHMKKSVPDATMFYFLKKNKSPCVLYSFLSALYFIGDEISADFLKDEIEPSLKANARLKNTQDVALNRVRGKGKQQCKLSYKVLKEIYGYYPLIEISTYPTLIQLKY